MSFDDRTIEQMPKKAHLIVARLLLSAPAGCASRDEIAAFLWPDAAEEQRRASLRTLVKRIRVALRDVSGGPFRIDEETIAFDAEAAVCDVLEFRRCVARGTLADIVEASRLYDGQLLEDCEALGEASTYWLDQERRRLGLNFARAAKKALAGGQLLGQPRLREAIELKILAARPIHADIHRAVANLHGRRASTYQRPAHAFVPARWPFAAPDGRSPTADDGPLSA